jgi:hypothetical protein
VHFLLRCDKNMNILHNLEPAPGWADSEQAQPLE